MYALFHFSLFYLPEFCCHLAVILSLPAAWNLICCGTSVNSDWRTQSTVCGEPFLGICFRNWGAEGCGNPHTAPVNQQLPLPGSLHLISPSPERLPAELKWDCHMAHAVHPLGVSLKCIFSTKLSVTRFRFSQWPLTWNLCVIRSETKQRFNLKTTKRCRK